MIIDRIKNADSYAALGKVWQVAFDAMKNYDNAAFEPGKKDLGDGVTMVQLQYETKDKSGALMEAHQKYADLMFLPQGQETIYYKPTEDLKEITMEFDPQKDALLAKLDEDAMALSVKGGDFVVFLPQDAHAPGCILDQAQPVRRIVIKVPLF